MTIADYDWCQAVIGDCTCDDDDDRCTCIDDLLHAPSTVAALEFDDWDGDPVVGQTACGIGQQLIIPGPFSRMGCDRCPRCCDVVGMPHGKGSPKNCCGHPADHHVPIGNRLECWHPVGEFVVCGCRNFDPAAAGTQEEQP